MYANHPKMAAEWEKETPKGTKLPERVKKASLDIENCFIKIAKELFNPIKTPPVPARESQKEMISAAKTEKMKGMTPVEYRNDITSRRTGIISRNRQSAKAT